MILTGDLDIRPKSDLGIVCSVDNRYPTVGSNITITIKVTNYMSDIDSTDGIIIQYNLPHGLIHKTNTTSKGKYNNETGEWFVGSLNRQESAMLEIHAQVVGFGENTPTQMAILLDGSGSISDSDWHIMLSGLAESLRRNNTIPRDESVELTVIQFGGWENMRAWAQVEIPPTIIDQTNYNTIANNIENIEQLEGGTAMSCAINLASDILSGDPNNYLVGTPWENMFSTNTDFSRQIINIVTDGQPNILCSEGEYSGTWPGSHAHPDEFTQGKQNTEIAREYMLKTLNMNSDENDEIDAVAVGLNIDIPWMRDNLVWPQPGYDTWPPEGSGWVKQVDSYTEFA